uniref:Uncharacterized protein n=1 Tax=Lepeophtheirus salmonis TaxID=72036 RepID=A0A0K2TL79_LEPSM
MTKPNSTLSQTRTYSPSNPQGYAPSFMRTHILRVTLRLL